MHFYSWHQGGFKTSWVVQMFWNKFLTNDEAKTITFYSFVSKNNWKPAIKTMKAKLAYSNNKQEAEVF